MQLAEANLLASFAAFVVRFLRKCVTKTVSYASQVLRSVRFLYAESLGRRPGNGDADTMHVKLKASLKTSKDLLPANAAAHALCCSTISADSPQYAAAQIIRSTPLLMSASAHPIPKGR